MSCKALSHRCPLGAPGKNARPFAVTCDLTQVTGFVAQRAHRRAPTPHHAIFASVPCTRGELRLQGLAPTLTPESRSALSQWLKIPHSHGGGEHHHRTTALDFRQSGTLVLSTRFYPPPLQTLTAAPPTPTHVDSSPSRM